MTNYFEKAKTQEELKAIYKELVKKYHPDIYGEKGNDILKDIHNQLEKALKNIDKKFYNSLYNDSEDINNAEVRARKEAIAKEVFAQHKGLAYQYLFAAYWMNNLRPYNHRNPLTKHNFSGWNVWQLELKMLLAGYQSSKWSTFAQYKDAKNNIRKGEHGTYITLAIISKSKKDDEDEDETKQRIYYKGYSVFNEEQTQQGATGEEPKAIETKLNLDPEKVKKAAESTQTVLNLWQQKYEVVA